MKAGPALCLGALLVLGAALFGAAEGTGGFDALVASAEAARQEGRLDDAAGLYRDAVRLRPDAVEGHRKLATLLYQLEEFEDAAVHFGAVVTYQEHDNVALAMKGLCELELGNFRRALSELQRAYGMGIPNVELMKAAALNIALLVNRLGNPEAALELLRAFAQAGDDRPPVILAFGLATLRLPLMLAETTPQQREMALLAGRGAYRMALGARGPVENLAFEELVSRYPTAPGVHYAYGLSLQSDDLDRAILEFERELQVNPDHYPTLLQLSSIELGSLGNFERSLELAERARDLAPESPAVYLAMGRVLLEMGELERAIRELEHGARLAPEHAQFPFSLARAYRRTGRRAEAKLAQERFERLRHEAAALETLSGAPRPVPASAQAAAEDDTTRR